MLKPIKLSRQLYTKVKEDSCTSPQDIDVKKHTVKGSRKRVREIRVGVKYNMERSLKLRVGTMSNTVAMVMWSLEQSEGGIYLSQSSHFNNFCCQKVGYCSI